MITFSEDGLYRPWLGADDASSRRLQLHQMEVKKRGKEMWVKLKALPEVYMAHTKLAQLKKDPLDFQTDFSTAIELEVRPRARRHCRFARPLIHLILDS